MKKGEIFFGRRGSDAIHPIVFLRDKNNDFFYGAMLTKSPPSRYPDNILMNPEHFRVSDASGNRFRIQFNNTHFVCKKLIKKKEWEPFHKVGELTEEGIAFLESQIDSEPGLFWENYIDI